MLISVFTTLLISLAALTGGALFLLFALPGLGSFRQRVEVISLAPDEARQVVSWLAVVAVLGAAADVAVGYVQGEKGEFAPDEEGLRAHADARAEIEIRRVALLTALRAGDKAGAALALDAYLGATVRLWDSEDATYRPGEPDPASVESWDSTSDFAMSVDGGGTYTSTQALVLKYSTLPRAFSWARASGQKTEASGQNPPVIKCTARNGTELDVRVSDGGAEEYAMIQFQGAVPADCYFDGRVRYRIASHDGQARPYAMDGGTFEGYAGEEEGRYTWSVGFGGQRALDEWLLVYTAADGTRHGIDSGAVSSIGRRTSVRVMDSASERVRFEVSHPEYGAEILLWFVPDDVRSAARAARVDLDFRDAALRALGLR